MSSWKNHTVSLDVKSSIDCMDSYELINYNPATHTTKRESLVMSFAEKLKSLMKDRNLSYARLAKDMGVSVNAAFLWVKKGQISDDKLKQLAAYFNVTPEYLWYGVGETSTEESSVLEAFRLANPHEKAMIMALLDAVKKRN